MRLKIRIRHEGAPFESIKHLVYIPQNVSKISEVEEHIKDVLGIKSSLVLRSGQFILPKKESVSIIEEGKILDCYVAKGIQKQQVTSKKAASKKKQRKLSNSSSSVEIEIKQPVKKPKLEITRPIKKVIASSSSSASEESDSSSNKSIPIKRANNKITIELPTKKPIVHQILNQMSETQDKPKINTKINLISSKQPDPSQHQSASNRLPSGQHRTFKLIDPAKQYQPKSQSVPKPKLTPPSVLKNLIQPKVQPKRQIAVSKVVIQDTDPIESDWIQIPIKSVEAYTQSHHKGFLIKGDKIQYKITQFDEEKYIPVLSDWISGTVSRTEGKNNLVLLVKNKEVNLSEINLFGLKIRRECLQGERLSYIQPLNISNTPNTSKTSNTSRKSVDKIQTPSKDDQLLTQLNYYFGDKNYNVDNYLIAHASKHPQLYIPLKCFMNFNKLKHLISTEEDLDKFIRQADLSSTTFEVHPTEKLLRKKGLKIQ